MQTKASFAQRLWRFARPAIIQMPNFIRKPLFAAKNAYALRSICAQLPSDVSADLRKLCENPTVRSGPFAGMRYLKEAHGSAFVPKLLGCYEMELHSDVAELCATDFDVLVDIGCAEGYYAIGFLHKQKTAKALCYDISRLARANTLELAELNALKDRVSVYGLCKPESLETVLRNSRKPLIICDIEGAELHVLDPVQAPALARCEILVELHDCLIPGIAEQIRSRFEKTHRILEIKSKARTHRDVPPEFSRLVEVAPDLVSERLFEMSWFRMTPLGNQATGNTPRSSTETPAVA